MFFAFSNYLTSRRGVDQKSMPLFWLACAGKFLGCLLFTGAIAFTQNVHSREICLPFSLDVLPAMPPTISLTNAALTADRVLYEAAKTNIPKYSGSPYCSSDPTATLRFTFLPSSLFVSAPQTIDIPQLSNPLVFKTASSKTTGVSLFATQYAMKLYQQIYIGCSGAVMTYNIILPNSVEYSNLTNCLRDYTLNYTLSIFQNNAATILPGIITQTESVGFKLVVELYVNGALQSSISGTVPGSTNLIFNSGKYCTYTLSSPTLNYSTVSDLDLFYDRNSANRIKRFSITSSNCSASTSGGGPARVFWRFDRAGTQPQYIATGSGTTSANVVTQIDCTPAPGESVTQTAADNTVMKMPLSTDNNLTRSLACTATLMKDPIVSRLSDITAGTYRGTAYLIFQFD